MSILLLFSILKQAFKLMQNKSSSITSTRKNTNEPTGINGTELVINKTNNNNNNTTYTKTLKWIKISCNKKTRWEPIYIIRSSAPNRGNCEYFIGKSIDNKYRTYHIDELYDYPDSKYSKTELFKTMTKSLNILFNQTTINENAAIPLYLYQKSSESNSIFSSFNIFQQNNTDSNTLSLDEINECEFHESAGIDEYDRIVTGVWITTNKNKEKTYMSIDKIKTISYIDDVNIIKYNADSNDNEWVIVNETEEENDNKQQALQEEIIALRLEHNNSLKLISKLEKENVGQEQENMSLSLEMNELKESMRNNDDENMNKLLYKLDEKQKEIDRLRQELIARSNAKQLNSKFPTVEEVCQAFRSIKNQEFQSFHSKLTKPLRKHKMYMKYNKYYVNKISHQLLFETLCKCYAATLIFHNNIYKSIGNILQISAVEDGTGYKDDDKEEENNTLEFLFHRYLTNNYETMKQSKEFKEIMQEKIFSQCLMEYEDIINILSEQQQKELINALRVFINKCCDVCWTMILQRPKLTISPDQFVPEMKVEFDENKQNRMLGSSKKDKYILYYVWPGIAQNNIQLDNVKSYVVQRDKDFTKMKK